jgi:hypothetical protein
MGGFAIPQLNPTGATGAGSFNTGGGMFSTSQGFGSPQAQPGTGTGGPGNMGFGNMNPNPATSSVTPNSYVTSSIGANSGTQPGSNLPSSAKGSSAVSTINNPYGQTGSQQWWTQDYLEKTFGGGMGSMIYQYLMSNGGFNSQITQQAVDATTNSMTQQSTQGANDITARLSAMGVSGGSSEMTLPLEQYQQGVTASENAITANDYMQMWQQSQQNELNAMEFAATGTGKYLANKPTAMDYVSQGLSLVGDAVGLSGLTGGFGGGGGGGTTISDNGGGGDFGG